MSDGRAGPGGGLGRQSRRHRRPRPRGVRRGGLLDVLEAAPSVIRLGAGRSLVQIQSPRSRQSCKCGTLRASARGGGVQLGSNFFSNHARLVLSIPSVNTEPARRAPELRARSQFLAQRDGACAPTPDRLTAPKADAGRRGGYKSVSSRTRTPETRFTIPNRFGFRVRFAGAERHKRAHIRGFGAWT